MTKYFMALAATLMTGTAAFAQYSGPSDLDANGGKYAATTVAQVLADPRDDMDVQLEGRLIRELSKERFMFADDSGEIRVEIDRDDFPAGAVDENTRLRIMGEVDTHRDRPADIEVERAVIMK